MGVVEFEVPHSTATARHVLGKPSVSEEAELTVADAFSWTKKSTEGVTRSQFYKWYWQQLPVQPVVRS